MDHLAEWTEHDWRVVHFVLALNVPGLVLSRAVRVALDLLGWWPHG